MRAIIAVIIILLGGGFLSFSASAATTHDCTLTKPIIVNYGTVSSVVVSATPQSQTFNIQISCPIVLAIAAPGSIVVAYTSATTTSGSRAILTSSTTDTIPLRLMCITPICTSATEISVNGTQSIPSSTFLGLLTNKQYSLPFTLSTVAQSVAAGSYATSITLTVTWDICTAGALVLCLNNDTGSDTLVIPVTLNVTNDCATITAPDINFGSAPVAGSFSTQSGTITLVCTKSATYTVGISDGQNASGGVRNMLNGVANLLSYDIYQSTSNNRWGSVGSQRWSSTAATTTSPDTMTKTYSYTAKIFPTQNTPPAGVYNDTLVVDVAF
ncbi:SCPU domain-containing protein [Hafnia alvei]|uniref:Csu type fimbrial protein n=1 Tax=Hafnia alvei TaxID=569 RepID=UPI0010335624|nr:spore coat U domain-containing protein [Hafnia alvei]TBL37711.1 SCPU domain-containing protein [Hafnia alvei]